MDIKSILVFIFFLVHFSTANVFKDLYSGFNNNINKVYQYTENIVKKPISELSLEPTEETPKPVYKPVEPVIKQKAKKPELVEICALSFRKSDIVMITVVKKNKGKVFQPITLDPTTFKLSFAVEKKKMIPALVDAFKSTVNKIPINLQLDPKELHKLPKLSDKDDVILTIIRAETSKKPAKVVSHFVNLISVAPMYKTY